MLEHFFTVRAVTAQLFAVGQPEIDVALLDEIFRGEQEVIFLQVGREEPTARKRFVVNHAPRTPPDENVSRLAGALIRVNTVSGQPLHFFFL